MKNFLLGIAAGIFIAGLAAEAVGISFEDASLRDVYAASALSGMMDKYTMEERALRAFQQADYMIRQRKMRQAWD